MIEIPVSRWKSVYGFVHVFDDRPSRYLKPGEVSLCGVTRLPNFSATYAETDKLCKKCVERLKTLQRDLETETFISERI